VVTHDHRSGGSQACAAGGAGCPRRAGRSGVGEDDLPVIDGLLREDPVLGYRNLPEADMPVQ
jgi:hypothetical protein